MFKPAIKWIGVKGKQSNKIVSLFPKNFDSYYEPFCGSCAVLYELLKSSEHTADKFYVSDFNSDLISTWIEIKKDYKSVLDYYKVLYNEYMILDWGDRKIFYKKVRERFNKEKSPYDFFFIMRTAVNGMPRYNKKGEFNTSNQLKQNPISPKNLQPVLEDWNNLLNLKNVIFECKSYDKISPNNNDVVYFDPPYSSSNGMYFGDFNYNKFFSDIKNIRGRHFLSFDGYTGKNNYLNVVPENLFSQKIAIKNGNSSFRRQKSKVTEDVFEYLYYNE